MMPLPRKNWGQKEQNYLNLGQDDIRAAESLEDLRYVSGSYHELSQNRKILLPKNFSVAGHLQSAS